MIQLQALNYIVNKKDVDFLTKYDDKYYFNYKDQYNFVLKHFKTYKTIPDIGTVLDHFPDFTPMDVSESVAYLEQRLYEEYVYNDCVETINASETDFAKDAVKTKDKIIQRLQSIQAPNRFYGIDIIKNARDRYDILLEKQMDRDAYLFSTNLTELDMILNGGLRRGEELIVIYARTNNAKTWIAEKLAVEVWAGPRDAKGNPTGKGVNVGFFSPEMSATEIGYRFDTLFKNFDNHGITGADAKFNSDPYKKYVNTLAGKDRPLFNVVTPLDFPDKRVTVTELRRWIEALDLKMIVIDGLTYLTNERGHKGKNTTENLTEIAEDLMLLSMEKEIPIIAVMQANRTGARDSDGEASTESPELDTIRGSDGISHNASRAISVYKAKDVIKLYLSKNRYGEKGQHLFYQYDINTGTFTYTANPKDGIAIDTTEDTSFTNDTGDAI